MTVASPPPPPQDPYAGVPPTPKKTSPWIWVGAGCLVLLLICAGTCAYFGYKAKNFAEKFANNPDAAAIEMVKLAVRANPDVELVSTDEAAKTVTIRNKKDGKEVTLNFEDIKNGKLSMEGSDGSKIDMSGGPNGGSMQVTDEKGQTTTIGGAAGASNLPPWIPLYPGATSQGAYSANGPQGSGATTILQTTDSVDKVLAFYEDKLKGEGYAVEKNSYQVNNQTAGGTLTAKSKDGKQEANLIVGQSDGKTAITVSYTSKP
ncbi:MAG TPA: hypothetical protein VN783_05630 [Thermoanaerobaculia bacterium]|nr:hypothetical protein [Thermoanaerobaculia bacterium]